MKGDHDPVKRRKLIKFFKDGGTSITEAAEACGFHRVYLYTLRRKDPEIAAAWPGGTPATESEQLSSAYADGLERMHAIVTDPDARNSDAIAAFKAIAWAAQNKLGKLAAKPSAPEADEPSAAPTIKVSAEDAAAKLKLVV